MISPENQSSLQHFSSDKGFSGSKESAKTVRRIGRPPISKDANVKGTISDLTKLYQVQSNEKNETLKTP